MKHLRSYGRSPQNMHGRSWERSNGVVTLFILRVGKRNDGEVYRGLEILAGRDNES
jgi:hypothetical protein